MEILNENISCSKCMLIEQVVKANQIMIQQQIKLIKILNKEKDQLSSKYEELSSKFLSIPTKSTPIKEVQIIMENKQQQTQQLILEQKNQNNKQMNTKSFSKERQSKSPSKNTVKVQKHPINKQNIGQYIPIVMIRKNQQYFSRKRKNSNQQENNTKQWIKAMQTIGSISSTKFKQKTFIFLKKSIPHQLRHIVWPLATQNLLGLTDELYFQLLQRKDNNWVSSEVKIQINKDICRSFSGRTQYESAAGLREDVTQVLQLFHLYRPDVSYVQGMTYPVIVLTIIVGKVKAFNIFSNLILANPFFKKLFTFQSNFILVISRTFDQLLLEFNQEVASNLRQKNIDSQTFLVEWIFTIFSRSLSFQATLKFWDQLLYIGEVAIFRLALAIMDLVGSRLLDTNYQETIGLIQGFGGFGKERKLIDSLSLTKLSSQKLHKTIQRMQRLNDRGQLN